MQARTTERARAAVAVPRQDGRVVVVTGASAGIGLATAEILAHRGAHVVLAVRDVAKGRRAAAGLRAPADRLDVRRLDLADLASVAAFADDLGDLVEHRGGIDVLVNNAGVMATPRRITDLGVDDQLATNHLGHLALTLRLLPVLRDRVVVVSSQSHRRADLDLTDLDWSRRGYRPYGAYGASKLANLHVLLELQRRLTAAGSTLRVLGAHPGTSRTAITQGAGSGLVRRVGHLGHPLVGMPPWRGALPVVHAATRDLPGNTYLGPDGPGEMFGWPVAVGRSAEASDPERARATWEVSLRLLGMTSPV